jgi:DNA modification methylase
VRNPKRRWTEKSSRSNWYSYYAGYSDHFVQDALSSIALRTDAQVLDPWNGSGTSTQLASELGYRAIGFDLNPAMVIVAKARLLDYRTHGSLRKLARNIVNQASRLRLEPDSLDPLTRWFDPTSASIIRTFDHAIQALLLDRDEYQRLYGSSLADVSSLAAFFYIALFRSTRGFLGPFLTSNPTWIKDGKAAADKLCVDWDNVTAAFLAHTAEMDSIITNRSYKEDSEPHGYCRLDVASADAMPLADAEIDAVVTSPPYLTRIDYVVATRPELAILGCTRAEDEVMRNQMTGTPTMAGRSIDVSSRWGTASHDLLTRVEQHSSRASATYYYNYFVQYFDSIFRSLAEVDRTLVPNGKAVIVVQDSYYKEIHVNLPQIITEMGESIGWRGEDHIKFEVGANLAAIHPQGRNYRKETKAVECALIFSKSGLPA